MQAGLPIALNAYFYFIVGLMLLSFLLETLADALNERSLQPELPQEFRGLYDDEKYRSALEYQRANIRFDRVRRTFGLIVTLGFIVLGGFEATDRFARHFGLGTLATGLIFGGTLLLARSVVNLPFSGYDTFVLEERYGLNKTTAATFLGDLLKGAALAVAIGAPIFALITFFLEKTGPRGWLYSWLGFTAIQLLLAFLAPALILPLFNKFEPIEEGELKREIERFALRQDFHLRGIYKMDGSRRSTRSNAFFTGFGRFRRLVLFDTLIERHTQDELVAILAHEIGHFKRRHIQKSIGVSVLVSLILFYTLGLFLNNPGLFAAFGMRHLSVYASLIFMGFLYGPILRVLSILGNLLSRRFEFEADRYAVEAFDKPQALASALKKLSMDNLSNLTPHPLKVLLDYTHPPVLERIRALQGWSRS